VQVGNAALRGNTDPNTIGGKQFQQEPSDKDKKNAAKTPNATHMGVGASSQQVYFYNNKGVQATVPLKAFPKKKVRKN